MGLDTSHNCWHGPYSAFGKFRSSLAAQIGIGDLDEYDGYGKEGGKDIKSIEHDLMPLFDHSDCDGVLIVEDSKRIANGLNQVLDNFNEKIEKNPEELKRLIIQFRDGLLDAISRDEIVEFD